MTVLSTQTAQYQLSPRMIYPLLYAGDSQRSPKGGNGIAHFLFARLFHLFTDLVQVLRWRRDVELANTKAGGEGKVEIA
jgi:hypothetical protein